MNVHDIINNEAKSMTMNRDGKKIELTKSGDSMKPKWNLKIDGKDHGTFDSEKAAMRHSAKLKEAPVGALKQIGRKVGAKAAGAVGMKGTAAGLSGAAETGDVARQLNVDLKKYAGQTGMNLKQLDAQDLAAFLKSKGFPTTPLAGVSGVLAPKQIDQALLKAAQEKAKVGGAKASPGVAGSGAAAGSQQQGGGFLDRATQKVGGQGTKTGKPAGTGQAAAPGATTASPNPDIAKQIEAVKAKIQKLNAQQKQELVGMI